MAYASTDVSSNDAFTDVFDAGTPDSPGTMDVGVDTSDALDAATDSDGSTDGGVDGRPDVTPQEWDGTISPDGVCTPDGFCVRTPLPTGFDLHDIWAASATDVWVSGGYGTLIHWDGSDWTGVTGVGGDVERIDGCASDDVWAVDSGRVLNASEGEEEDTENFEPRLLHWDGSEWSASGPAVVVHDVECRATNDVWAATEDGLYHFDGGWTKVDLGADVALSQVTADADHVYASGTAAVVWDGTSAILRYGVGGINDLLVAFGTCWAASNVGVLRWTGTDWETVFEGLAQSYNSLAHTRTGLWAEGAENDFSGVGGDTAGSWAASSGGGCADEHGRVHRVGDELWLATAQVIGQSGTRCTLQSRSLDVERTEEWESAMTYRDTIGSLVAPDVYVRVVGDEVLRTSNTETQVVATLPDDGDAFPAFRFAGYDTDEGVWATRTGLTVRFDGMEWSRFPADGRLREIVGDSSAAFGISTTGSVLRWTPAGGWTASTDGASRLYRYDDDTWLVDSNQDVRWFDGSEWVNFGHSVDGVDVDIEALIGFGGAGSVWARTSGTHVISRLVMGTWEGVVRLDELPSGSELHPSNFFGASGDELWGPGMRWNGSEWVLFTAGMGWELDRVIVDHGQLWLFVANTDGYALRRNLH